METRQCAGCGKHFHPRPQSPQQKFCSEAACQKERRRRWQAAKRQSDPDYRENQARAQAKWVSSNPTYWSDYRQSHPDYAKRNRERQRERDARRRVTPVLAKSDAWAPETGVPSGIYRLIPVTGDDLAKSDAWMVRITEVSGAYAVSG
jgi:endogenous inhibitor of DNA gyrase (YacG/DUF329 family)